MLGRETEMTTATMG